MLLQIALSYLYVWIDTVHVWSSEGSMQGSLLSFHRMGPWTQNQVIRLDSGYLNPLRHLADPNIHTHIYLFYSEHVVNSLGFYSTSLLWRTEFSKGNTVFLSWFGCVASKGRNLARLSQLLLSPASLYPNPPNPLLKSNSLYCFFFLCVSSFLKKKGGVNKLISRKYKHHFLGKGERSPQSFAFRLCWMHPLCSVIELYWTRCNQQRVLCSVWGTSQACHVHLPCCEPLSSFEWQQTGTNPRSPGSHSCCSTYSPYLEPFQLLTPAVLFSSSAFVVLTFLSFLPSWHCLSLVSGLWSLPSLSAVWDYRSCLSVLSQASSWSTHDKGPQ